MKDEKVIMYDSSEAAEQITLTGWISKGEGGRFWYKDEHAARYSGCTHMTCECGNIMRKGWLKCDECRRKISVENYNKRPFEEWDGEKPVVEWDGDNYFFNLDDLHEFMGENELEEIDLLICDPVSFRQIDYEDITSDTHEDWEPSKELEMKVDAFNKFIKSLPPHSWTPGKIRTSYKMPEDLLVEWKEEWAKNT